MSCISKIRNILASATVMIFGLNGYAGGIQISQITDQSPDLNVFLSGSAFVPSNPSAATSVSAALGATPLKVKTSVPWNSADGISLVVALDVSASLGNENFSTIKRHLNSILSKLPPRSQVALLAIGSEVRTVRPFGPISAVLGATGLDTLTPNSPETALYEAVLVAQDLAAKVGPGLPLRRAVLVLTDGIDDSRRGYGREEALLKISKGDAPVFAMALASGHIPVTQRDAIKSLAQIARASGGAFVQSTASGSGEGLSTLMAQALQAQLLTLDCSACPHDGAIRTLQVSLQQREGTASDSRDVRLLAIAPVVPASSSASKPQEITILPAPDPAKSSAISFGDMWIWLAVAVIVAGISGFAIWKKSQKWKKSQEADLRPDYKEISEPRQDSNSIYLSDDIRITPADEKVIDKPKSGRAMTLDVSGKGRVQIRVGDDFVLGRSQTADLAIEKDGEASNRHAALYMQKHVLMVRDLDSSNGTFLNGTRIVRPEPVQDRDLILIGRTEVRVYLDNK